MILEVHFKRKRNLIYLNKEIWDLFNKRIQNVIKK